MSCRDLVYYQQTYWAQFVCIYSELSTMGGIPRDILLLRDDVRGLGM